MRCGPALKRMEPSAMTATPDSATPMPKLAYLPVPLFASVMGLAGLTLALHMAETTFGWGHVASTLVLGLTVLDFALITVLYALKALRHPGAVLAEWHHPIKLAFFPAISISLLLI